MPRVLRPVCVLLLALFWWTPSAVAAGGQATLTVRVKAEHVVADVLVDGNSVGQTPVQLQLEAGEHELMLRWQGHQTTSRFTVRAGDKAVFEASTEPIEGDATIEIDVEGADVWVDDQRRGASPVSVRVSPGRHRVRLYFADGSMATRDVVVGAGGKTTVRAQR